VSLQGLRFVGPNQTDDRGTDMDADPATERLFRFTRQFSTEKFHTFPNLECCLEGTAVRPLGY
jgi:hypothetical protein